MGGARTQTRAGEAPANAAAAAPQQARAPGSRARFRPGRDSTARSCSRPRAQPNCSPPTRTLEGDISMREASLFMREAELPWRWPFKMTTLKLGVRNNYRKPNEFEGLCPAGAASPCTRWLRARRSFTPPRPSPSFPPRPLLKIGRLSQILCSGPHIVHLLRRPASNR